MQSHSPHPLSLQPVSADDAIAHIGPNSDIIVPIANGEPSALMDALERQSHALTGIRVHQMHTLVDRPYLHGAYGENLRHVSYFLSAITRDCFAKGHIELVPNNFSEVPALMALRCRNPIVFAAVSPPDRHGYFSLGTNSDYVAPLIGFARFFVEANASMPRTFGRNQIHISQVEGWIRHDRPLIEVPPAQPSDVDHSIAAYVAERIGDGSTLQTGIGAIPNAILAALVDHRDLGVHTELISDGLIDLIESGVVNGIRKHLNRTKTVGTFALGTQRLYDFLADNPSIELWPVDYVNDPKIIAREPNFVSINATLAVDLYGQCASETIGATYWSSSGGQADFARGSMMSEGGKGFIVLHSTTHDPAVTRIVPTLEPGSVVTTLKNTVDHVVTEYGVTELRGKSVSERARGLISIAHPDHRDELSFQAKRLGYLN